MRRALQWTARKTLPSVELNDRLSRPVAADCRFSATPAPGSIGPYIRSQRLDSSEHATPRAEPTDPTSVCRAEIVVNCLAYLRRVLRDRWIGVLHPFPVQTSNPVDHIRAADVIAAHLGLVPLRCLVAVVHLDDNVGGVVKMTRGTRDVFIEVSPSAARFAPTLLAALAHEVTHKRLFDRGIERIGSDQLRYEMLVDAAAIYLGLGKLLLNGYEYARTIHDPVTGAVQRRHHRFGYLTVGEVAFAHAMTCRIRRHLWLGWSHGLSPFACRAVRRIEEDMTLRHHLDAAPRLTPRQAYL